MNKVLIDTDVILDFFFDRKPFSIQSSKILTLCKENQLSGFVTPVIISNIYYMLRKTATHQKVILNLKKLLSILEVSTIKKETILDALNSEFTDFEDALQNFSAQNGGKIKIIITRNIKDYKNSKLSIMSPTLYLKSFS